LPNKNEFTEAVLSMKDELDGMRKKADKSRPIPFMQRRVRDRASAASQFQQLSPQEKEAFIQENGLEATLKLLRGTAEGA
tara:strand:- start:181 stop:420 length:240 start_codon:yes stop_codon:yes gene_type:complete